MALFNLCTVFFFGTSTSLQYQDHLLGNQASVPLWHISLLLVWTVLHCETQIHLYQKLNSPEEAQIQWFIIMTEEAQEFDQK